MKNLLLWIYWYPFRKILQTLPIPILQPFGRILAGAMYLGCPGRRATISSECRRYFGRELTPVQMREAVKATFRNLVMNELEMMFYPKINKGNVERFVVIQGEENLHTALRSGRGAMLAFGHFGANQMIMPAIGYNGYAMSQLSAPATVWEEVLTERQFSFIERKSLELRWKHEQSLPVKHINIFGSLKEAFKCLRKNEVLGVAVDGGGGKDKLEIDFLGTKAFFSPGTMDIAFRTNCNVLPTFMVRDHKGMNTLVIEPPIEVGTCERDAAIKEMASSFVLRLEEYVKKYPDHYLNFLVLRRRMTEPGERPFIID